MSSRKALIALLLLAAFLPLGAQAGGNPVLCETTVVDDTPEDFPNGGLDIVAVHVCERHFRDDDGVGHDLVFVRIEVRDLSELKNLVPPGSPVPHRFQYVLHYKLGSADVMKNATVTVTCATDPNRGPYCLDPVSDPPHIATVSGTFPGVSLVLDAVLEGLVPGATVTDVWAASGRVENTAAGTRVVYMDTAPHDNANQPSGPEPTPDGGGTYVLEGVYPFLRVDAVQPGSMDKFAVAGGKATFTLTFNATALNLPEAILLAYSVPDGWSVDSNQGNEVPMSDENQLVDVDFTFTAAPSATIGTSEAVVIDAALKRSGGHVVVPLVVHLCAAKCDVPGFEFDLLTGGPFKKGEGTTLEVNVEKDGRPLNRFPVAFELRQGASKVGPLSADFAANGTYRTLVAFPSTGEWTVEVYVEDELPYPFETFTVTVEGAGGASPGAEAVPILASLALVLGLRARRPDA